jgi:very-short-patch-repair endonuclease
MNFLNARARMLRAQSTDAERRFWYLLRSRRMTGVKFRRQHPIGPYIVDFVCLECRLAVELDGGQHQLQAEADRRRDQWLGAQGFVVLRFGDNDALAQTQEVMEEIWRAVESRRGALTPGPLPLARARGAKRPV